MATKKATAKVKVKAPVKKAAVKEAPTKKAAPVKVAPKAPPKAKAAPSKPKAPAFSICVYGMGESEVIGFDSELAYARAMRLLRLRQRKHRLKQKLGAPLQIDTRSGTVSFSIVRRIETR